jgi:hypothetical protein
MSPNKAKNAILPLNAPMNLVGVDAKKVIKTLHSRRRNMRITSGVRCMGKEKDTNSHFEGLPPALIFTKKTAIKTRQNLQGF